MKKKSIKFFSVAEKVSTDLDWLIFDQYDKLILRKFRSRLSVKIGRRIFIQIRREVIEEILLRRRS